MKYEKYVSFKVAYSICKFDNLYYTIFEIYFVIYGTVNSYFNLSISI